MTSTKILPPPSSPVSRRVHFYLFILSSLFSLVILAASARLLVHNDSNCEQLLHMRRLRVVAGISLFLIFIIVNALAYFGGARLLIPRALHLATVLVVMLIVGIAYIDDYGERRSSPGSPDWLRTRMDSDETWDNIKTCLFDSHVCSDIALHTSMKKLSTIEDGCCKPAKVCGMEYVNATYWKPAAQEKSEMEDCGLWSNDMRRLCYDCESCKEGYLATVRRRWRGLGVFLTVMAVLMLAVHAVRFFVVMAERQKLEGEGFWNLFFN